MDVTITLTQSQAFLVDWLSKEDWSAYGECRGPDLDYLVKLGLATCEAIPPHDRTGVGLTETGRRAHVAAMMAAKLGKHYQSPMEEMIIYGTVARAVSAGFRPSGRHTRWPHLTAWWPGAGDARILQQRWQRITVDVGVYDVPGGRKALEFFKSSQAVFGHAAIWIEV